MKYSNYISFIVIAVILFSSCQKPDVTISGKDLLGTYQSKTIFMTEDKQDTVLEIERTHDFKKDGTVIITYNSDIDSLDWFINSASESLYLKSGKFFGSVGYDINEWNRDIIELSTIRFVNVNGSLKDHYEETTLIRE